MSRPWLLITALCLSCAVSGCRPTTVITGSVTYDGQPVQNGAITFYPADGRGPSAGAMVAGGQYRVERIAPGKKMVQVVGALGREEGLRVPQTTEELRQQSERLAAEGSPPIAAGPAALIPPNAVGNCSEVQVQPGRQRLDFHLQAPPETP
jgi:hypothetical protein